MSEGNVRWFDKKKGYGFVEHEGIDIYIHYTEIKENYIPETNDIISFEIINGEKGLKAQNIIKVG